MIKRLFKILLFLILVLPGFIFASDADDVRQIDFNEIIEQAVQMNSFFINDIDKLARETLGRPLNDDEREIFMDIGFIVEHRQALARAVGNSRLSANILWVPFPVDSKSNELIQLLLKKLCGSIGDCVARFDLADKSALDINSLLADMLLSIEANHKNKKLIVLDNASSVLAGLSLDDMNTVFDAFRIGTDLNAPLLPETTVIIIDQLRAIDRFSAPERHLITAAVASGQTQLNACRFMLQKH